MSMRIKSPTVDEPAHLTSGYLHLTQQEFRFGQEHPPLIKSLAALPLLLFDLGIPDRSEQYIQNNVSGYGKYFLFQPGHDVNKIVFLARIPMVLLSMLMGYFVFLWAKSLYGIKSGLLALTLFVFSPNILAYSRLVTTDLSMGCFFLIACFFFWSHLSSPSLKRVVYAGLFLGLALTSKYSALLLAPVFLLMFLMKFFYFDSIKNIHRYSLIKSANIQNAFVPIFQNVFLIFFLVLIVIFASYQFRWNAVDLYFQGLEELKSNYFSRFNDRNYSNYLMGEFSKDTFWEYYLIAFLVKTPVYTIILTLCAFTHWFQSRTKGVGFNEATLLLPILVILVATGFDAFNLGLRRIIIIYPFLFIFISRILGPNEFKIKSIFNNKMFFPSLVLVVGLYVAGTIKISPDYLTYFNEIAGGPRKGIFFLDDSNIDWGQDMKRIGPYMEKHGIKKIKLFCNNRLDLKYYGINGEALTSENMVEGIKPGYYAISIHNFNRLMWLIPSWRSINDPIDVIGNTIYIFKVSPPSQPAPINRPLANL